VVIQARGKDQRGNGTATATVTASFAENGEQTDVEVLTDLAITGKPAQFGRGVISDVSDKLLDQFVGCVSGRFSEGLGAAAQEPSVSTAAAAADARHAAADIEQTIELEAVPAAEKAAATAPIADVTTPPPKPAPGAAPLSDQPRTTLPQGAEESTLNVLSTVGPVLLKRYGPALAIFGLLLFVVIKIIRRKS
jgi:hypothetical protein